MTGAPIQITVCSEIDAPPERVWPHLVDWENLVRWMREATEVKLTSSQREGAGVEAVARLSIGGIPTRDPIRVTAWEPPHLLEIEHRGWVKGSGAMFCERRGGASRLWWTEIMHPPWGLAGRIGMSAWRPLMRRTFERDLALLRELAEAER